MTKLKPAKSLVTISDLLAKYQKKITYLDLEILIAHSLGKTREFVLTYPDYEIPKLKIVNCELKIARRAKGEPIAYITGHKEFYGLDFIVDKHTLVPRPETEMIVDDVVTLLRSMLRSTTVIDLGTGSGNIIISIANTLKKDAQFFASDISEGALKVAKKNAKMNQVEKKIKFFKGSLLEPFLKTKKLTAENLVITANLPYLSKDIYDSAPIDVKKFEPKSALYSPELGLQHYRKLLEQTKKIIAKNSPLSVILFFEISPEQKTLVTKIIKAIFPSAKVDFQKDLARKWRVCKITI